MVADTPDPPYVAVIFSSLPTADLHGNADGYAETAAAMDELAAAQPGYLGVEHARTEGGLGITVSYWVDEAAARDWKRVGEHAAAQRLGRQRFYASYRVRIATVTREYGR